MGAALVVSTEGTFDGMSVGRMSVNLHSNTSFAEPTECIGPKDTPKIPLFHPLLLQGEYDLQRVREVPLGPPWPVPR